MWVYIVYVAIEVSVSQNVYTAASAAVAGVEKMPEKLMMKVKREEVIKALPWD